MRKIEEVMDEVSLESGYINWDNLLFSIRHDPLLKKEEISRIIKVIAKEYSRNAEKYYKQPECNCIEGKFDIDYREVGRAEGFTVGYNEFRNKVQRDLEKFKRKIENDGY